MSTDYTFHIFICVRDVCELDQNEISFEVTDNDCDNLPKLPRSILPPLIPPTNPDSSHRLIPSKYIIYDRNSTNHLLFHLPKVFKPQLEPKRII